MTTSSMVARRLSRRGHAPRAHVTGRQADHACAAMLRRERRRGTMLLVVITLAAAIAVG